MTDKQSLGHIFPVQQAKFVDTGITKAADIVKPWDGREVEGIGLVGLPLSKPSISHSGASFAPETMRAALNAFTSYAIEDDVDLQDMDIVDFGDVKMHITDIQASHQRIEDSLTTLYHRYPKLTPILLGGDHSVSCPSIKAFAKAKGRVGVIQFDAHHDLRNLEDGGPSNGTPFRGLLEAGAIKGEDLIQIGIRSFSNGKLYSDYAKAQGVTLYTMKDVRERHMQAILDEALNTLLPKVDVIYLSVDIDVLDQAHAPGCPAIGPGGMDSTTLLEAIKYLAHVPLVQGMDIVEIDPKLDFRDMTSRVGAHTILQFIVGKALTKSE